MKSTPAKRDWNATAPSSTASNYNKSLSF